MVSQKLTADDEKHHKLERYQRLVDTRLAFSYETHFSSTWYCYKLSIYNLSN